MIHRTASAGFPAYWRTPARCRCTSWMASTHTSVRSPEALRTRRWRTCTRISWDMARACRSRTGGTGGARSPSRMRWARTRFGASGATRWTKRSCSDDSAHGTGAACFAGRLERAPRLGLRPRRARHARARRGRLQANWRTPRPRRRRARIRQRDDRRDGARAGSTGSAGRDDVAAALGLTALRGGTDNGVHEVEGERWLVQLLTPTRTLLIVGATEIAAALCTLAAPLGWRAVLIDPRDDVLAEPRFAAATERHAALPADIVATRLGGPSTAVVVVAHEYKVEIPVLRVALRAGAPYVGLLG